jgi:hypothetical protein
MDCYILFFSTASHWRKKSHVLTPACVFWHALYFAPHQPTPHMCLVLSIPHLGSCRQLRFAPPSPQRPSHISWKGHSLWAPPALLACSALIIVGHIAFLCCSWAFLFSEGEQTWVWNLAPLFALEQLTSLTSLSFCFIICKLGIIKATSWGGWEDKVRRSTK